MPVGDSHLAFAEAAAQDGIAFSNIEALTWLTELGPITLEDIAEDPPDGADPAALLEAAEALQAIYEELGGDIDVLYSCRATLYLPVDLVHKPTGTIVEIDESHHFTSFRLKSLDSYPPDAKLGFDADAYRELCRTWAPKMDAFNRNLAGKGFGIGGVQRQRAYHDSLRDLGAPAMGRPPVVRIVALDADGAAAYQRERESLLSLLGAAH